MGKLANYHPYNTRLNSGFFYAYNMLFFLKVKINLLGQLGQFLYIFFKFGNIKIWG